MRTVECYPFKRTILTWPGQPLQHFHAKRGSKDALAIV
jgi:hypothetical protein